MSGQSHSTSPTSDYFATSSDDKLYSTQTDEEERKSKAQKEADRKLEARTKKVMVRQFIPITYRRLAMRWSDAETASILDGSSKNDHATETARDEEMRWRGTELDRLRDKFEADELGREMDTAFDSQPSASVDDLYSFIEETQAELDLEEEQTKRNREKIQAKLDLEKAKTNLHLELPQPQPSRIVIPASQHSPAVTVTPVYEPSETHDAEMATE